MAEQVAETITQGLCASTLDQWRRAGGHILLDSPPDERTHSLTAASQHTFSLLQTATALDAAGFIVRDELRSINMRMEGEQLDEAAHSRRRVRPCVEAPPNASIAAGGAGGAGDDANLDDVSDGSDLQGGLIQTNVRPGKPEVVLSAASLSAEHPPRAPDGSLRLVMPHVLATDECHALIAGGLVAMAGAFSRCGQTTLGLSPALASRMRAYPPPASDAAAAPAAAAAAAAATAGNDSIPAALPLLYRTVERIRRRVAAAFGRDLDRLRMSDATLTRLQPVASPPPPPPPPVVQGGGAAATAGAPEHATAAGALDVGLLRADQFCYWRPHIDQVSVDEYEISALLYLTRHAPEGTAHGGAAHKGAAQGGATHGGAPQGVTACGSGADGGDFRGGRLVFHDPDVDLVIQPEPGMLVAFTSGEANLHAVQRVTAGSRFALTMWFTSRPQSPAQRAAEDPTHAAMQRWACAEAEAAQAEACAGGAQPRAAAAAAAVGLPELPELPGGQSEPRLPTREEALVTAALCSLPANDPLGRALILSPHTQLTEALSRGVNLPPGYAHAAPLQPIEAALEPPPSGEATTVGTGLAGKNATPHPLLRPRVAALAALLTTLQRAQAQRAAVVGSGPGVAPRPTAAAAAAATEDDPFSVFD